MGKYDNDTIRDNINRAIRDSKMSRSKVTELANISYPNLTRFLNKNKNGISLDVLSKLSAALNVPVSYFLGKTDRAGKPVINVANNPIPEEWDILLKKVMNMPEKERNKIFTIFKVTVETIAR